MQTSKWGNTYNYHDLISVTGHVVITSIYNYHLLLIARSPCLQEASALVMVPFCWVDANIPEESSSLELLTGLGGCSFPLAWVTKILRVLSGLLGSVACHTHSSYPHCVAATQFPLDSRDQSLQPEESLSVVSVLGRVRVARWQHTFWLDEIIVTW